ncbi:hypothetical protein Psi01_14330 [Planobispora siamensis]|uniref:FAD-binding PCMH-type domain-containing protein n=1 Tax=Planobispora siamensis TaxID=936338 RepID=A0A8J3SB48_9ACTN|nr:hypothetical protein Psi01_14330 [Planobispora siamensis]
MIAGGHSLLPMMKLRLARPEVLIDINDLAELSFLGVEGNELVVGALVRHAQLPADPTVGRFFPIFRDAERVIADPVARNRGTVGGSLCQADPSEDLSAAFAAVRATAVIQGPGGEREVPIREFHRGPYETAVEPGELLTRLRVPLRPGAGSAYEKVERRVGDWPVAAAGALPRLDGGVAAEAGIGLTAVGAEHFAAPEAEEYLTGRAPTRRRSPRRAASPPRTATRRPTLAVMCDGHEVTTVEGLERDGELDAVQAVLATDKVRFQGQEVAFVVADDPYTARDAVELIDVEYEPLEPVVDARRALDEDAPVIRDDLEGRTGNHIFDWEAGDRAQTDAIFERAEVTVAQDMLYPRVRPAPLELPLRRVGAALGYQVEPADGPPAPDTAAVVVASHGVGRSRCWRRPCARACRTSA